MVNNKYGNKCRRFIIHNFHCPLPHVFKFLNLNQTTLFVNGKWL